MGKAGLHVVPLTAEELMWLHGLTVEQGLRQGYCIVGHEKEWRAVRQAAREQERQALGGRRREWDYLDRPKRKRRNNSKINTEESFTMDKNTRIMLVVHLMSSESFMMMPPTEKAALLTELVYGESVPATKHPGGRSKKAASEQEGDSE